jgi:hypothetical protein
MATSAVNMATQDRAILEKLDVILRAEDVRAQIQPIVERVRAELQRKTTAVMTWEPIPLSIYGNALPAMIRSSWVFILRAGADYGSGTASKQSSTDDVVRRNGRYAGGKGEANAQRPTLNAQRRSQTAECGTQPEMAVECFSQRSRRATGAKMDFYPRKRLASAGGRTNR